jgi:hypothetical protein
MVDNYAQNWYEIAYEKDGEVRSGFILEGALSMVASPFYPENEETPSWFLWNITGFGDDNFWQSRATIVQKGEELSSVDFDPIYTDAIPEEGYSYTVDTRMVDGSAIADHLQFFVIDYIYEACGFLNGCIYLTWNGDGIAYGFETNDVSEAGLFSVWTEVVFPDDEGGEPGKIKVTEFQEEFREEVEEYVIMNKEITVYRWDGQRLVAEE